MNRYDIANFVRTNMDSAPQFARIIKGARSGTVGRIVEVNSPYFSEHHYRLAVAGRRRFWVKGEHLELLENHEQGTSFMLNTETPVYKDTLGRELGLDQTVIFPRATSGATVEMVMGTIKSISPKGAIYVRAFKLGSGQAPTSALIRLACPERALILDKMTVTEVMVAKMQSF